MAKGYSVADKVTGAMATWTFIVVFLLACFFEIWGNHSGLFHFDPQTIILNLVLSLIAAIQGSIIMISQNRAAGRDRAVIRHVEEMDERIIALEETNAIGALRREERQARMEELLQNLSCRPERRRR